MNNKEALNVLMNNYKSGKLERLVQEYGADSVPEVDTASLTLTCSGGCRWARTHGVQICRACH